MQDELEKGLMKFRQDRLGKTTVTEIPCTESFEKTVEMCISLIGQTFPDYADAMGHEELRAIYEFRKKCQLRLFKFLKEDGIY